MKSLGTICFIIIILCSCGSTALRYVKVNKFESNSFTVLKETTPTHSKLLSIHQKGETILKRNGEEISAKVSEIGKIKYNESDNLEVPSYYISKSDVLVMNYSNLTQEAFIKVQLEEKHKIHNKSIKIKDQGGKIHPAGIVGVALGVLAITLGFSVLWGFFALGIPALILGTIVTASKKRHPEKYRGYVLSILATILGVIAIVILTITILSLI